MTAGTATTLEKVLLSKAAIDAGFDLERPTVGDWACFAVSGQPLVVWLRSASDGIALAISDRRVLDELELAELANLSLPQGAAGARLVDSHQRLMASLARARVLDATLPTRLFDRWQARVAALGNTERDVIAQRRVGQDLFREGLMAYWGGRCAATGIDIPELLRASHIKPWRDCNDDERLDIHNGLLLAAHVDALFDAHLLAFEADGTGILSTRVSAEQCATLGFSAGPPRVRGLSPKHLPYLALHRHLLVEGSR